MARKLTRTELDTFAEALEGEAAQREFPHNCWADLKSRRETRLLMSPELRELLERRLPQRSPF